MVPGDKKRLKDTVLDYLHKDTVLDYLHKRSASPSRAPTSQNA